MGARKILFEIPVMLTTDELVALSAELGSSHRAATWRETVDWCESHVREAVRSVMERHGLEQLPSLTLHDDKVRALYPPGYLEEVGL